MKLSRVLFASLVLTALAAGGFAAVSHSSTQSKANACCDGSGCCDGSACCR